VEARQRFHEESKKYIKPIDAEALTIARALRSLPEEIYP
jgi:hypothetical protein